MREARMRTCACDSSPDRYSTVPSGFVRATFPAVSSNSVDLPIPGSPATRTTEPGTMPPPSTRSNSPNPVGMRATLSVPTSLIGLTVPAPTTVCACVREVRPGAAVRDFAAGRASWNSSTVPHWPHSGQRPYHLGPFQPHSVHTYCVVVFAIVPKLANFRDIARRAQRAFPMMPGTRHAAVRE